MQTIYICYPSYSTILLDSAIILDSNIKTYESDKEKPGPL
jgi:hypothetical protein